MEELIGRGTDGWAVPSTVQGESGRVTSPGRRGLTARTGWQELERKSIFALDQKDAQTCEDSHWPPTEPPRRGKLLRPQGSSELLVSRPLREPKKDQSLMSMNETGGTVQTTH
ncbi:hypothetical protein F2Q70_00022931 [Brassica cretica]|uniref:Uncharacterized protein n=1 Tax=Brassica cretica TaxID=69181 RepID=A0A8S9GTK1_BRACR|nr:hypothetical protein F2Q70_00022931 [Brassica cretica]